ncbi:hypothetical protein D3C87_08440 [compost metagenome]
MKTAILIPVCFVSIFSSGQQNSDQLVMELSPINASIQTTLSYNIQGKITYRFNKYLSIAARHNQEIAAYPLSSMKKTSPNVNRKNSLSDIALGVTLLTTEKPRIDPTETEVRTRSWSQKRLQLDLGLTYYKFAAKRTDYYSYAVDDQGNYKVINSINRLSASLGFSFILDEYSAADRLKRQHTFSAGVYYGLNYDLQGYIKIPGENPSERAPKKYAFNRAGYYIRYNFRQQINEHLFLGADLLFTRMPHVEYRPNPDLFVFRGGEAEIRFQPYAGITIGWVF